MPTPAKKKAARRPRVPVKNTPEPLENATATDLISTILLPSSWDRTGTMVPDGTDPQQIRALQMSSLSGDPESQQRIVVSMEETWPRYIKDMHELRLASARGRYVVEPYAKRGEQPTAEAQEKADFVEAALERWEPRIDLEENGFQGAVYDLCDAVGKGVCVQEVIWQRNSDGIIPRATVWVDPRHWGFDSTVNQLGYKPNRTDWRPFAKHKFLIGKFKNRSGNSLGYGLARSLGWWWGAVVYGRQWLARYAEQHGQPFRLAKHPKGTPETELVKIMDRLKEMGEAGIGLIPKDATLELIESSKSAGDLPQSVLLQLADQICDILILGQTLTTDVGDSGSRALGEVHQSVRKDRLVEVAEWSADMLNMQLVPSIIELNWGNREELPYLRFEIEEARDPVAAAQRDQILHAMGVPLSVGELRERHSLAEPESPEDTLAPAVGGFEAFANSRVEAKASDRAQDGNQLLSSVLEELTGLSDAYTAPVRPIFAQMLMKAQDGSLSDEELVAMLEESNTVLPGLMEKFNHDALAQLIERAAGSAAINGGFERGSETGRF